MVRSLPGLNMFSVVGGLKVCMALTKIRIFMGDVWCQMKVLTRGTILVLGIFVLEDMKKN